jgi:hypothetical protein
MKNGMLKSIVFALSCVAAVNAEAIGNGFYIGVMAGPATNSASSLPALKSPLPPITNPGATSLFGATGVSKLPTTQANPKSTQFATRIFLGNQFNQFAGFELGGTFFSTIQYDTRGVAIYGGADQRVRGLDLVMKGILPLATFSLYGKAGVAATYITTGPTFDPVFQPSTYSTKAPKYNQNNAKIVVQTTYKHKLSPTFSVGASYDINQSWLIEGSYNVVVVGNNIGKASFAALGISYHFTDKYCGQFLCDD